MQDASGIQVTTTAKGAHSAALQAALARAAGNGIPVRVDPGGPMRPA
ncbi:hypothetical protein ACFQZC_33570 [Streptacidiphilus monticola]